MSDDDPRGRRPSPLVVLPAVVAAAVFVLPLAGLLWRAPWASAGDVLGSAPARDALRLSLLTSLVATAVALALGGPLAWIQARVDYPGRRIVRAVTLVPMVLPPVVGGVALLLALGRKGLVGEPLASLTGITLPFTTAGAVLAEAFVAMPFFVLTAEAAFRSTDRGLEEAARTLGASRWYVFRRVVVPQARPALVAGTVLCWARALGEFGATITFAGNRQGETQTLPLFVYVKLEGGDLDAAVTLSLVLLAVSLVVLVALRDRWLRAL